MEWGDGLVRRVLQGMTWEAFVLVGDMGFFGHVVHFFAICVEGNVIRVVT